MILTFKMKAVEKFHNQFDRILPLQLIKTGFMCRSDPNLAVQQADHAPDHIHPAHLGLKQR